MRKITLLLSFIACVGFMQAQLLLVENFEYTAGTELKANGWAVSINPPTVLNSILVNASSISYSGYPGSGVGQEISLKSSGEDYNKSFIAITTGTIYYSALVNISAAQANGDYFMHIGDSPTGSSFFARLFAKSDGTKVAIGIQNVSGGTPTQTYLSTSYDLNTTLLVVVKYVIATNTASVIVNPSLESEPTTGWVSNASGTTAAPTAGFTTVNVRQGNSSNAPTLKLDGIRVATSYAALFGTTSTKDVSADILNIKLSGKKLTVLNAATSTVEIYSVLGAKVATLELLNGSTELNLAKGLYVVRAGKKAAKIML